MTAEPPASGWRYTKWTPDGLLGSTWGYRDRYETTAVTARCKHGHTEPPVPDCPRECGIHFVEDARAMYERIAEHTTLRARRDPYYQGPPLTFVEAQGRVIRADTQTRFGGALVWRAATVRVRAILTPRLTEERKHRLKWFYDVPVGDFTLGNMLAVERILCGPRCGA